MFWSSADRYILIDLCRAWPIWLIVGQADQNVNLKFEWVLCPGWPTGGRVDGRAGEAEGDHRGAGADLRWNVRILDPDNVRISEANIRQHVWILIPDMYQNVWILGAEIHQNVWILVPTWPDFCKNVEVLIPPLTFCPDMSRILVSTCPASKSAVALPKANIFITAPANLAFLKNQHSFLLPCHHPFSYTLKPQTISVRLDSTCV